ncbi:MAG: O-antigen ligase family protein [Lachnospiraceae bacterium]|nr:O-antigen ligase family protein [Lachnospiraceae bacterium]
MIKKMCNTKIDIIKMILIILVLFMPTHRMLFDAVLPWKYDNLWRDMLLILGIVIVLAINKGIYLGRHGINIILMWIVCGIYLFFSDRFVLAANLARTYLIPTLIYFIVINIRKDEKFIGILEKIFVYTAVILAIFGMVQAFILGEGFLIALGYEANGEYLASNSFYISHFFGRQRVTSTFAAPNICGLYFGMVIIVLIYRIKNYKYGVVLLGIMLFGLATTFSRSAMLGTAFALLVVFFMRNISKIILKRSTTIKLVIIVSLAVVTFFGINYMLDGLITDMLKSSVMSVVKSTDPSANKHMEDLVVPIKTIIQNPLGLGFGNNGPMVLEYYKDANLVESSIYLLMYDFGIIGALIFLLPYVRSIFRFLISMYRKFTQKFDNVIADKQREYEKIPAGLAILLMVVSLLLPSLQSFEILFVFYLFLAISEIRETIDSERR